MVEAATSQAAGKAGDGSAISGLIDRVDALLERFRVPMMVLGVLWFAAIFAQYAGLVRLPDLALLHGTPAIMFAAAYNAVYWGYVRPRVIRRRAARDLAKAESPDHG